MKKYKVLHVIFTFASRLVLVIYILFARHYLDTFELLALWSTWCGNACVGGQESPSTKQLKQIIQIEHNIFKNPNRLEANQ